MRSGPAGRAAWAAHGPRPATGAPAGRSPENLHVRVEGLGPRAQGFRVFLFRVQGLGFRFRVRINKGTVQGSILGGSWVVISGVTSKVTIIITHIRALITPLITTHEPPSKGRFHGFRVQGGSSGVEGRGSQDFQILGGMRDLSECSG